MEHPLPQLPALGCPALVGSDRIGPVQKSEVSHGDLREAPSPSQDTRLHWPSLGEGALGSLWLQLLAPCQASSFPFWGPGLARPVCWPIQALSWYSSLWEWPWRNRDPPLLRWVSGGNGPPALLSSHCPNSNPLSRKPLHAGCALEDASGGSHPIPV